ncbi:MAG: hypothetical protein IKK93_11620 [Campylobacter sp.]|nr:hypothetical protein [Campylobacter sp.]
MSRSYRRGYTPSYRGDKDCRTEYHRSVRRKIRTLLKEELKFIDDGDNARPSEKITAKGRDFGCKSADPWSWPSDGRSKFEDDLCTLRKEFNEALKEQHYYYNVWYNPWEEYQRYRDAKFIQIEYDLFYKVVVGWHKEAHDDWRFFPDMGEHGRRLHIHWVTWEPTYKKVEKILDHYPLMSDLETGAIDVSFRRSNWRQYVQASYDGGLIEFLFHRNIIPNNFSTEDQLMVWLHKNEEKIIRSWYKVLYKK